MFVLSLSIDRQAEPPPLVLRKARARHPTAPLADAAASLAAAAMPRRALLRVAARALSRTVPRPTPLPTLARGARAAAAAPRRLPTLPALARCFAASSAAAHGAPEAPDTDPSAGAAASVLSEVDYHRLADETLDTLCEDLEDYLEVHTQPEQAWSWSWQSMLLFSGLYMRFQGHIWSCGRRSLLFLQDPNPETRTASCQDDETGCKTACCGATC